MPGINLSIAGSGKTFEVHDACTTDSTQCTDVWHKMFQSFSVPEEGSFEHTARLHENEELPDLEEEIELDQ